MVFGCGNAGLVLIVLLIFNFAKGGKLAKQHGHVHQPRPRRQGQLRLLTPVFLFLNNMGVLLSTLYDESSMDMASARKQLVLPWGFVTDIHIILGAIEVCAGVFLRLERIARSCVSYAEQLHRESVVPVPQDIGKERPR